jgi:NitT/TauT family transport system substrate-binding protein
VKKVLWLLAIVASMALLAVGCGDDDDGGDAAAGGSSATTTETAAATYEKCTGASATYQLSFIPNAQHTGFLVAYDKKLFDAEGVKVKMKPGGPTVNPALQLAQGSVDFADLPLADAMSAVAKGGKMKLVAQTAQQTPLRYISWKDVPLSSPEDLKGKSTGIQQTGNVMPEMAEMLHSVGLSTDDVKTKTINFDVSDFMAKKVDVFPLRTYAHIAMLEAEGVKYPDDVNVLDPNKYGAGLPDEGIWVNEEYFEKNQQAVACVLKAIKAGWEAAIADPDEAKKIVGKYAPKAAFPPEAIDTDVDATLEYATQNGAGEKVEPLTVDVEYIKDGAEKLMKNDAVRGEVDIESAIDLGPLESVNAG